MPCLGSQRKHLPRLTSPEIFALLIFARLTFVVIYYLRFQEVAKRNLKTKWPCTVNRSQSAKSVRQHLINYNYHLSTLIIDNDHELDRTSESAELDEYRLIDLPMEQPDGSLHHLRDIGIAPTLNMGSMSGLAPREGSSTVLRLGIDPCQGSSLSPPPNPLRDSYIHKA